MSLIVILALSLQFVLDLTVLCGIVDEGMNVSDGEEEGGDGQEEDEEEEEGGYVKEEEDSVNQSLILVTESLK